MGRGKEAPRSLHWKPGSQSLGLARLSPELSSKTSSLLCQGVGRAVCKQVCEIYRLSYSSY